MSDQLEKLKAAVSVGNTMDQGLVNGMAHDASSNAAALHFFPHPAKAPDEKIEKVMAYRLPDGKLAGTREEAWPVLISHALKDMLPVDMPQRNRAAITAYISEHGTAILHMLNTTKKALD